MERISKGTTYTSYVYKKIPIDYSMHFLSIFNESLWRYTWLDAIIEVVRRIK